PGDRRRRPARGHGARSGGRRGRLRAVEDGVAAGGRGGGEHVSLRHPLSLPEVRALMPLALITGASSGLGAEFARQLARRGADLVLVARSADALEELAGELRSTHGVAVDVLPADLTDESELARVVERLTDAGEPVDLLVNNAGFGRPLRFADNEIEDEVRHLRVHVEVPMRLMHAALG